MNLKGRDFLKLLDYSEEEIRYSLKAKILPYYLKKIVLEQDVLLK